MAEIPVTGYLPPGAYTFRDPLLGTAVLVGAIRLPAYIGLTRGRLVDVNDEAVVKGAIGSADALANAAERIKTIALTSGGANAFLNGVDFRLSSVDWSPNTLLAPPSGLIATPSDLGGMLVAGVYTYLVTARKQIDVTGPVYGETIASAQVTVTVGGSASGSVALSWNAVSGATQYRVYRLVGTTFALLTTVNPATSYIDNGTATPDILFNPPTVNNAFKQPATGSTYYVSYQYRQQTFLTPTIYTSVSAVLDDHGPGSDLAVMADLALSQPPQGQGAPAIMLVAIADQSNINFLAALDKLRFFLPSFIQPLGSNEQLNQDVVEHVVAMSSFRQKRERTAVLAPPALKSDGSPTTDTDIRSMARALDFLDDFGAPSGRRVLFISETLFRTTNVLQTDGTRADEDLPGYFLAGATAAREAALSDTATPMTNKTITNALILTTRDEATKDLMATDGVCVIHDEGDGLARIRQQLTAASINAGRFVEDQEFSIVLTDDFLAQNLRIQYKQFIGQKLTPRIMQAIKGATIRVLGNMKKQELIDDFDQNSVEVRKSTVNPTFVLVFFKYFPVFPTNAVIAKYGFDTIAG
jgi:hypothetical protein